MSVYATAMALWGPEIRLAQGFKPAKRHTGGRKPKYPPQCSQCGAIRGSHGSGRGLCAACYQRVRYQERKNAK